MGRAIVVSIGSRMISVDRRDDLTLPGYIFSPEKVSS